MDAMRIGVDVGGTKIEALAMGPDGMELLRYRVATPRGDYAGTVSAIAGLVTRLESELGMRGSVGVGIPGTLDRNRRVKNANSTWLNGRELDKDMEKALARPVRLANDANCLALSEATDGAAAGKQVVFAAILGTGCGGGLAIDGRVHAGQNGVAGEWGHNPLPWMQGEEWPGPECYCGRHGCIETFVSGTGLAADYARMNGQHLAGEEIVAASRRGEQAAMEAMTRYVDRLARALAHVVNMLDPDVIVLGGGLSRIERLYAEVPGLLPKYVFGGECDTPVLQAVHGDSSGVRGAAWLFNDAR